MPSNLERLLFELHGRNGTEVAAVMARSRRDGALAVSGPRLDAARTIFAGHRVDDAGTTAAIAALYRETGELVDPHSAIGIAAARAVCRDDSTPIVALATAHPAKFPDAVASATGVRPSLPARLGDLFERPEHLRTVENDLATVQASVRERVRRVA